MAAVKMPAGLIAWMQGLRWGAHHDEWHYTRRWDFWTYVAANHPDPAVRQEIAAMIQYANTQGWERAALQEGEPGSPNYSRTLTDEEEEVAASREKEQDRAAAARDLYFGTGRARTNRARRSKRRR